MSRQRKRPKFSGTSRSFKGIGGRLQIGEQRLAQQADININAIKLAKEQHKEATNIHSKGLANKAAAETTAKQETFKLARLIRNTQYENLSIKADRDVDAAKGRAAEALKKAQRLESLIPQRAALITQAAKLGIDVAEKLHNMKVAEEQEKNDLYSKPLQIGQDGINNATRKGINALENHEDTLDLKTTQVYIDRLKLNLLSTGAQVWERFSDNDEVERKALWDTARDVLGVKVNRYNADEVAGILAQARLNELGLARTSKHGQKIVARYRKFAAEKARNISNVEDSLKTSTDLETNITSIAGLLKDDITSLKPGTTKLTETAAKNRETLTTNVHLYVKDLERNGVYKDGDTFVRIKDHPNSRMHAAVYFMDQYLKTNGHKYDKDTALNDVFGTVRAFDKKDGTQSTELLLNKLSPVSKEQLEKTIQASHDKKNKDKEDNANNQGNILTSEYTNALNQWVVLKNDPKTTPEDYHKAGLPDTLDEFHNVWIKKIAASEATDKIKTDTLVDLDLMTRAGAKHVNSYVNLVEPLSDYTLTGDKLEKALLQVNVRFAELGTRSKAAQEALRPEFTKYTNILKANFGSSADWMKYWTNKFDAGQGAPNTGSPFRTKGLHATGTAAAKDAYARSVEIYTDLLPDFLAKDSTNGYAQARVAAFKLVEEEWKAGAPGPDGKPKDPDSRYARERITLNAPLVYTNKLFDPTGSTYDVAQLEARLNEYQGKVAPAMAEWNNVNIPLKSPETIAALFYTGEISMDDIFKQGDLVSPDHISDAASVGTKIAQPYVPGENWRGDVSIKVTPQVTAIAKALGWSEMDVYNEFFKRYGHNVRFAADRPDASVIGITVNGTRKWDRKGDRFGLSIYGQIINQGFHAPKKEHIRLGFEEGLDTQTSFFQSHDIKFDDGGNFLDPEDAINKSVFSQPFVTEEMINKVFPFGLQGVQHLVPGREAYDRAQLEKSGPKKKYISPRERKFGRKK